MDGNSKQNQSSGSPQEDETERHNEPKVKNDKDDEKGKVKVDTKPLKLKAIEVPTKVADGGSTIRASNETEDHPDLFMRYSNQNVRMTHLLGLDEEDSEVANEDNTEWQQIVGYHRALRTNVGETDRKTRLSWELYPDVFYLTR